MYCERWSNEAATVHADITADRPSQEPARRPIGLPIPFLHGFRNLNFHCHLRMNELHQNELYDFLRMVSHL